MDETAGNGMLKTLESAGQCRRLQRLFGDDGRALVVGFDHAVSSGAAGGIMARLPELAQQCIDGGADGLQMSLNSVRTLPRSILCSPRGLVLRIDRSPVNDDVAQVVSSPNAWATPNAVSRADGDVVVVFFIHDFRDPEITARNAAMVGDAAEACRREGIPLMVEVMTKTGAAEPSRISADMIDAARIGFELGADLLKIDRTPDVSALTDLVQAVPVPLLLRGGAPRDSLPETLHDLERCLENGFAGAVYGRSVWQSETPEYVVSELARVMHG